MSTTLRQGVSENCVNKALLTHVNKATKNLLNYKQKWL